ncbi:hypothetical protein [Pseudactinotalea sp.]|uniref:hypothetical protein n=1 Tax=Pseudactinotalea sp. TaxID=1926260 RepID=UPI003B3B070F
MTDTGPRTAQLLAEVPDHVLFPDGAKASGMADWCGERGFYPSLHAVEMERQRRRAVRATTPKKERKP